MKRPTILADLPAGAKLKMRTLWVLLFFLPTANYEMKEMDGMNANDEVMMERDEEI